MLVVAWHDPVVDVTGFDPRSRYVELFWLPVVGPSASWLMRRLADELERSPDGASVELAEVARGIGLGRRTGAGAPIERAIERCRRFGCVRRPAPRTIALRRRLPMLPPHRLAELPVHLQALHRRWEELPVEEAEHRCRARLLAMDARQLGDEVEAIERRLLCWGFHPAVAYEAAGWAAALPEAPGPQRTAGVPAGPYAVAGTPG